MVTPEAAPLQLLRILVARGQRCSLTLQEINRADQRSAFAAPVFEAAIDHVLGAEVHFYLALALDAKAIRQHS